MSLFNASEESISIRDLADRSNVLRLIASCKLNIAKVELKENWTLVTTKTPRKALAAIWTKIGAQSKT